MDYTPLDFPSFEIRLLTLLQPSEGEAADGIVHCTLRHDYLIERFDGDTRKAIQIPDYVALSYCCKFGRVLKVHPLLLPTVTACFP
jgi:hypothetical protein